MTDNKYIELDGTILFFAVHIQGRLFGMYNRNTFHKSITYTVFLTILLLKEFSLILLLKIKELEFN
jgi:hypothetical protein